MKFLKTKSPVVAQLTFVIIIGKKNNSEALSLVLQVDSLSTPATSVKPYIIKVESVYNDFIHYP